MVEVLADLYQRQEYETLIPAAMGAAVDECLSAGERGMAYWYAAQASHRTDRYYAAASLAERGLEVAAEAKDQQLAARFHFMLAGLKLWIGDLHAAKKHGEEFQKRAAVAGLEPWRVGAARYNLGLVAFHRKEYQQAHREFLQAAEVLRTSGRPANAVQAILDAASIDVDSGLLDEAEQHLSEAEQLLAEVDDESRQAQWTVVKALYWLRRGEVRSAVALCESILSPQRKRVDAYYKAQAAIVSAEVCLVTGRLEQASMLADLAKQYAMVQLYPWLLNRVTELHRRIREAARAS